MFDRENDFDDLFRAVAEEQAKRPALAARGYSAQLLFDLLKAHAAQESRFDPTAYHFDGPDPVRNSSRGLMQIEGATAIPILGAGGLGNDVTNGEGAPAFLEGRAGGLYDPAIAIPIAAGIVATNLEQTTDLDSAIAAYNEGLGNIRANGITVPEYVAKVRGYLDYFRGEDPPADSGSGNLADGPAAPSSGSSSLEGVAIAIAIVVVLVLVLGAL